MSMTCRCRTIALLVLGWPLAAAAGPPLRWGGDSEGGVPYEFQDPRAPTRLIGFEVEIADAIGRKLDRPARFVQNQWDGLIPGLQRGNYDMVLSGLEITADRARVVRFSRPYCATHLQLAVRSDGPELRGLDDLRGRKVGTLKASLAQRLLEAHGGIDVVSYDGQINIYEDLANHRLDAALNDHVMALYYVAPMPRLKMVGPPIGRIEYGIAVRPGDEALLRQIDAALGELIASGELRHILERWNLWTPLTAQLLDDARPGSSAPVAFEEYLRDRRQTRSLGERLRQYVGYLPILGRGALVTVELSVLAMILAVALGLSLALGRLYGPAPLRWACVGYIEIVRGTPLLIQLFLIFYGLPHVGIQLSPMVAAVLGLGLNYAAYEAENYRAGIQSIPHTQMEAALALGMTRPQALRHVIVPQALRLVLPPVTNDFIALFKDSSLVSVITMVELTKAYGQLASMHYDYLGLGVLTAAMYFFIGLPFVRLARWAEGRFTPGERPSTRSLLY
jgi:polar amino acid transport system substrate-binding protein